MINCETIISNTYCKMSEQHRNVLSMIKDLELEINKINTEMKDVERSVPNENLALVHQQCHKDYHDGKLGNFKFKECKDYKETTFMNILRLQIYRRVKCNITYGYHTKVDRIKLKLEKTHYNDAIVISGIKEIKYDCDKIYSIKQFRKKKRSLHEATARKGRKEPNIEAKRNSKNTPHSNGFYLNDKVKVFNKVGWIS